MTTRTSCWCRRGTPPFNDGSVAGSFAGGTLADLRGTYGRRGAAWRATLLNLLQSETGNERFMLDGICVAPAARGKGVGTMLLHALFDEGKARHHEFARLDVADSNQRARALYERHGFAAAGTKKLGLLRFVFGFATSTKMVRPL